MLTEDYIMRMINQALAVLLRVLGFKQAGRHQEALQEIDQALEDLLGLRADLIRRLDDDSLLESLTQGETLDTDRLALVADFYKEEGDIYAAQNLTNDSYFSHLRALNFYVEAVLAGGPFNLPPPHEQIEVLLGGIGNLSLPPDTLYTLFVYFERMGQFQRAGAILGRLATIPELQAEVHSEQKEFYGRLLEQPDEQLAKGGLPRQEVEERLGKIGG
jgi:hypothetical protein